MSSWIQCNDLGGHIFIYLYILAEMSILVWLKTQNKTTLYCKNANAMYYAKLTHSSKSGWQLVRLCICLSRCNAICLGKAFQWICCLWQLLIVSWPANKRLNLNCWSFSPCGKSKSRVLFSNPPVSREYDIFRVVIFLFYLVHLIVLLSTSFLLSHGLISANQYMAKFFSCSMTSHKESFSSG